MHFVERGPEPEGLAPIRSRRTPKWVKFYRDGKGTKPGDHHWRRFHDAMGEAFSFLCGYCEETCKGAIDHFQPKSRFPQRVYEWSNWVFACHDCNHSKHDKWPPGGYVDPCAATPSARPESFFCFDTKTGEVLPRTGLSAVRERKAQRMIDDLQLNAMHHLRRRKGQVEAIRRFCDAIPAVPDIEVFVCKLSARSRERSSITRAVLAEEGIPF